MEIIDVLRIWMDYIEKLYGADKRNTYFSEREEGEINIPEDEQGYFTLEAEVEVALKEIKTRKHVGLMIQRKRIEKMVPVE